MPTRGSEATRAGTRNRRFRGALEPQSANEASKVLDQGLVQNKFSVGKPRALSLPTANVSYF